MFLPEDFLPVKQDDGIEEIGSHTVIVANIIFLLNLRNDFKEVI